MLRVNTHSRSGLAGSPLNNNIPTAEAPVFDSPRTCGVYWKYFVRVKCPFSECPKTVELGDLPSHVVGPAHRLQTHSYLASPLTFSRNLSTSGNTASPQLMSCDPIRFTFAKENFYLQTIASPDRRLLYHFVQMEGGEEDTLRFWVKISVSSLDKKIQRGQATMTMRPTTLDNHSSLDVQAISNSLVMTER